MAPTSDDYLMGLAAVGDQRAYVELVRRYEAQIRTLCSFLVSNEAVGAEVAQEVFVEVWEGRARYQPQGRFKELLYVVARNRCRSHGRKMWWRRWFPLEDAPVEAMATSVAPDVAHDQKEREALVRRALSQLPEHFRVPLALRFVDALDYAAIARIIGRTESAARSRVHYGLQALAKLLPPEVADGF